MTQLMLFAEMWRHNPSLVRWHCDECQAEGERLIAQYEAAQARGEYDPEGYTPAERKAQQRRRA